MESSGCAPRKPDRKTVEKNRRIHMKSLYSKLDSLLPNQKKDGVALTVPDRIIEAADYITELRERVEKLRERKRQLIALGSHNSTLTKLLPDIEVEEISDGLKSVKTTSDFRNNEVGFYKMIQLLEEEGVEVLSAYLPPSKSEGSVRYTHFLMRM
ncbi:basic helix-loop-helix (bHLH) DNA-binding superfamily protein [Rhynchospora pubera]|uniref:Basic helix-loop-helix (BHLH) DNA-binding superfamily protein n=1 Tax=Rhynchospora pubera TaxID=906938 RepID=A0AAV8C4T0_9POAL|nr:basic helix-loop-helix (bHLH) DNA-binding superfamily protein [Rhynchospora pubera]